MKKRTYKLVLTAILSALAVCGGSIFSFPIGFAKCAPTQSLINIVSGVVLGPEWAVVQALLTSTVRNLLGTGTILAYPGSIFGAWLSGWLFKRFGKTWLAAIGELIGTGLIGALTAYPIAAALMGAKGSLFLFVPSFAISAIVGGLLAWVILKAAWQPIRHFAKIE
ncbi:MAG: energy coupling factor transporter S component ThiW [Lactobacillus sp.]|nr:energy coupling factor transporter S component ThiW [Lactobacillus sp.]